ncbi:esterase/lipase family protein [Pedobacter psychroterrae]|uniref:Alpha/beta hydrolase n=1 Tax=Pedobacter psychroterrae TaxID=2530453 RepID=A0A4R0NI77_9SPHI|nr:alpha/beta hydrolase [Pedobacter psychroterrae]TCC99928.1 alpha/beta hydrolase [Pedobacter psychroterrae]
MNERIIIIHGYSDCSESFIALKQWLVDQQRGQIDTIYYADYQSREDSLSFNDVADGLNDELIKGNLINQDGSSDYKLKIIVHSTGGLVVRYWIWQYYYHRGRIDKCPITNIVMLAPANFGSPLAHRGKSFLGSLVKGRWKIGDFLEVGRKILDGLELASAFQWSLAHKDLLISNPYFNCEQIKVTILVGMKDYEGLRGWVNKPGTDGTVVISGTNLNAVKLTLEFVKPVGTETYTPHRWSGKKSVCDLAFGILPNHDHGTIVEQATTDSNLSRLILTGLADDVEVFKALKTDLDSISSNSYNTNNKNKYQQFIFHVVDDYGLSVDDFSLEFYVFKKSKTDGVVIINDHMTYLEDEYSSRINAIITEEVHQNSIDKSYRRLLVDHFALNSFLSVLNGDPSLVNGYVISMKVFVPNVCKGISYDIDKLENVVIYDSDTQEDLQTFFFENTTTLVELQVDRNNSYVRVGTVAISN